MSATNTTPRGFIALLTIIILGFVFLVAVISAAELGLVGRAILGRLEDKVMSEEYAEGCVQLARVQVASDPSVAVSNMSISYGDVSCTIVLLTNSGSQRTIRTHAEVRGATTNFEVVVDATTAIVLSWQEKQTLP
jgi:hypothetical protein